jgi:hypothetical protein
VLSRLGPLLDTFEQSAQLRPGAWPFLPALLFPRLAQAAGLLFPPRGPEEKEKEKEEACAEAVWTQPAVLAAYPRLSRAFQDLLPAAVPMARRQAGVYLPLPAPAPARLPVPASVPTAPGQSDGGLLSTLRGLFTLAIRQAFPAYLGLGLEAALCTGVVARCQNAAHGDFQCNNALGLAKALKSAPGYEGTIRCATTGGHAWLACLLACMGGGEQPRQNHTLLHSLLCSS